MRPAGRVLPPGEETERSVDVDGQRLRIAVRNGAPGRVPLLMLNGLGAGLELLQPVVDALDPALGVIRFDVPGIGGSAAPSRPYRFGGLCQMIAAMLTALRHDRADVLGISWGGGVAQHFAAAQAARCRRLVLVSTGTGMTMVPASPLALMWIGLSLCAADGRGSRTWRLGTMHQITASLGWTSVPFLPLLRQETLILSGADDPVVPLANAYQLRSLIPRSRLHVFPGGHLGLISQAGQLAPVIDAFLAGRLAAGRQAGGKLAGGKLAGPGEHSGGDMPVSNDGPSAFNASSPDREECHDDRA